MTTRLDLELDAREVSTKKSFTLTTALRFGGIDLTALQENKKAQQPNPLAFLTGGIEARRTHQRQSLSWQGQQ